MLPNDSRRPLRFERLTRGCPACGCGSTLTSAPILTTPSALLCAAGHRDVDLVGVSTVDGDTEWRAEIARTLVGAPVVPGARLGGPTSPSQPRRCSPSARSERRPSGRRRRPPAPPGRDGRRATAGSSPRRRAGGRAQLRDGARRGPSGDRWHAGCAPLPARRDCSHATVRRRSRRPRQRSASARRDVRRLEGATPCRGCPGRRSGSASPRSSSAARARASPSLLSNAGRSAWMSAGGARIPA